MKIKLNKPFARNGGVDEFDVKQSKKALNRLDYYQPHVESGITGIPDADVFSALKAFQKDSGLRASGAAKPDDETVAALNTAVSKTPPGKYVWRTVGDDRVRAEHAALEGEVREWNDSPDPGEDFNCRCWAEKVEEEKKSPLPQRKPKKPVCFDGLPWEDTAVKNLREHELDIEYPYLDTKGKITVGIGVNINEKFVFMGLPWKIDDAKNGRTATKEEIETSYNILRDFAVKSVDRDGDMNVAYTYFANKIRLRLSYTERESLFKDTFRKLKDELPEGFPEFKCYPPPAKVALMDMHYNMGKMRFNAAKWPGLFRAVKLRDWIRVAHHSNRKDVGAERNRDTFNQFMEAEEVEIRAQEKN